MVFVPCPSQKKKKPSKVNSFPGGTVVKNPPANAGDTGDVGLTLGSEISPGLGNGNPLQYSCLEKPWTDESGGYI